MKQRPAPDIADPAECGDLIDELDGDMLTTGVFLSDRRGSYQLKRSHSLVAEVEDWLDDPWDSPGPVDEQQIADARKIAKQYDTTWNTIEDDLDILVDVQGRELLWLERLPTDLADNIEEVLQTIQDSERGTYRLSEMSTHSDEIWRHAAAWLHDDPAQLAMLAMDPVEHVRQRAAMRLKESAAG